MGTAGTAVALTLGRCRLLADALAQLVGQPELHADEGLPTLLRQLAPRLGPRQHVTHAALGQPQHLGTAQASPTRARASCPQHQATACPPSPRRGRGSRMSPLPRSWPHGTSGPLGPSHGVMGP